jgi:hypothetical protein
MVQLLERRNNIERVDNLSVSQVNEHDTILLQFFLAFSLRPAADMMAAS